LNLCSWDCNTLILGTFNPKDGPYADFYYGRVRGLNSWSNRFWPSLNEYINFKNNSEIKLKPGDINSKIELMTKYKFYCLDLIYSIETKANYEDINRKFADYHLMLKSNNIKYNTQSIIKFIKEKKIKKVISSWGKGTSLSRSFLLELNKIIYYCRESNFNLFHLPAFGRPKIKNVELGSLLFKEFTS
tara:strand:- start:3475 stop:4038 length:564 start_codon:yes stop_codon:yes gene_type:complete